MGGGGGVSHHAKSWVADSMCSLALDSVAGFYLLAVLVACCKLRPLCSRACVYVRARAFMHGGWLVGWVGEWMDARLKRYGIRSKVDQREVAGFHLQVYTRSSTRCMALATDAQHN